LKSKVTIENAKHDVLLLTSTMAEVQKDITKSAKHILSTLPDKSFLAVTDHQGLRIFYYPSKEQTNPIGKPIHAASWEIAAKSEEPGIFRGVGSDGVRRIFAFEQVRLTPENMPYLYVWADIPEAHILYPANAILARNLMILFITTLISLLVSWSIGKHTLISPIKRLVFLTGEFAEGNLDARSKLAVKSDEFGTLTKAFYDMADALKANQKAIRENETRFRLVMDSLNALIYVADMDTYQVLFINEYGRKMFGDITGKVCWQRIQKGQRGPCPFCTNKHLLDEEGKPDKTHTYESKNTVTGKWYYIHDRAIHWLDNRVVRLVVATDISEIKLAENRLAEETERLAVTLRSIGDGVITTDTQGRVVLINKVAEMLTGWDVDTSSGQPLAKVFDIINSVTRQPCDNPVEKVLASKAIIGFTDHTVLISKNGQERSIADSGAPIQVSDPP
jgi:PAS domain S-box-containing protein